MILFNDLQQMTRSNVKVLQYACYLNPAQLVWLGASTVQFSSKKFKKLMSPTLNLKRKDDSKYDRQTDRQHILMLSRLELEYLFSICGHLHTLDKEDVLYYTVCQEDVC